MPSRADPMVHFVPQSETAIAYLAGLIDCRGHFAEGTSGGMGIALYMTDRTLLRWINDHFGGSLGSRMLWISRQADLAYILPRLMPYLVLKRPEAESMLRLVLHHLKRKEYPATPSWRATRDELRAAVRAVRAARRLAASPGPQPDDEPSCA